MSKQGRPSTLAASNLVVSKCGLHSINDKHPGYGALLQTVNAAGRKLAVVKCRDNYGPAFEAKQLWPDVLTIGAQTTYDSSRSTIPSSGRRRYSTRTSNTGKCLMRLS